MKDSEQTEAFATDLDRLVDRYRSEFELTYAQVIGALYLKAGFLVIEAAEGEE
jgi:hypothetical protein